MEYKVVWTIDVDADNPVAAAREAYGHMRRPGSLANVFEVIDNRGNIVQVDLQELIDQRHCSEGG